jgi:hypothetical protein
MITTLYRTCCCKTLNICLNIWSPLTTNQQVQNMSGGGGGGGGGCGGGGGSGSGGGNSSSNSGIIIIIMCVSLVTGLFFLVRLLNQQ